MHPRGAALPQGRPHLVVPPGLRAAARRARVRRLPSRPPRHRVVQRRRHRRVPARRSSATWPRSSPGSRARTGATATSGCTARRTPASTRCRWRASGPEQLKAIIAIYGTDDRYTDDVHYRGGILKVLDLVDYCHYMTPMNALPPVPAVWGDGWREEWIRRVETSEPWALTWLREQLDGPYWRHGSVRPDYERIACPTMIIAGWADGYRNNSLPADGATARLRACRTGCWPDRGRTPPPSRPMPGPRIDSMPEMVAWWDRWLRGIENGVDDGLADDRPSMTCFVRSSTRPSPVLDESRRLLGARGVADAAGDRDDATARGATAVRRPGRRRRRRVDRLRRPPSLGAERRPAVRRRGLERVGVGRRVAHADGPPDGSAAGLAWTSRRPTSRSSCATCSTTARRRWSRAGPSTSAAATASRPTSRSSPARCTTS